MEVGRRIKERRKSLGLSAETVADRMGVSPATVYRYESSDIMNMGIDKLKLIADALETTPAYLMGWNEESYSNSWHPTLNQRDMKEIDQIISNTKELLQQDGLMFDGKPADEEDIQSIISAMEIGLEMAKKKSKEKFTPKKYRK